MANPAPSSCCCCGCIHTNQVGIIEKFGKFVRTGSPGCLCFNCCAGYRLSGSVSLGLQIANVTVETKTRDNAVVRVEVRIHFKVVEEKAADAYYRFTNPEEQIGSFAAAIIRGEVPKYTLDEVFLLSDEIKKVVKDELTEKLLQYGFMLEATLLTRIDPHHDIKVAITQTQVNAFKRTAAEHAAELNKILVVKAAEADFEEKRLSGVGLAEERKAIMRGLRSSIEEFVEKVPGARPKDVMHLILLNQYFDSMKEVGSQRNNKLVLLPGGGGSSVGGGTGMMADLVAAQMGAADMK